MSMTKSGQTSKQSIQRTVYVGIDVAKETLAVDVGALFKGSIPNTPQAIRKMAGRILRACPDGTGPVFCAEHTGIYGQALADRLRQLGLQVALLPSQRVRWHALSEGIRAKTDPVDAAVIRDFAEKKRPLPTPEPTPVQRRLRDLTRTRNLFVKQRTALLQSLEATGDEDARTLLRAELRSLDGRIAKLEGIIRTTVESDGRTKRIAETLKTIKGVADTSVAVIVALVPELGTLGRRRAAALCGCAPYPNDSGNRKGRRKTGRGREGVRAALFMPALSALTHNPRYKAFYERLKKGRHKPGYVPRVAVMRKLFVEMDAVARKALAAAGGEKEHVFSGDATGSPWCEQRRAAGKDG
jgi:transposase